MTIRILTDKAKEWEAKGNNLQRLEDKKGKPIQLEEGWYHKGVSGKSVAERDQFAANALFAKGRQYAAEWNEDAGEFSGTPALTFGGVEFVETKGAWSDHSGGGFGQSRKYKAGGLATGYILVPRQPFDT